MKYLVFLFTFLLILSCSDEQISNPTYLSIDEATLGVRSKISYSKLDPKQILSIEDFEYDNLGNLQKKIYYGNDKEMVHHYELFIYNNEKLISKLNYHSNINSTTGFIILDSTTFSYSEDLLVSEKKIFPYAKYYQKIEFEYNGERLIKKTKYRNEKLIYIISYEYFDGELKEEILYDGNDNIISIYKYVYHKNHLIEKLNYSNDGELLTKISYEYYTDGKLKLERVEVIAMYLSTHSHIIKYEY